MVTNDFSAPVCDHVSVRAMISGTDVIKTKVRNRLDPDDDMHFALSKIVPCIGALDCQLRDCFLCGEVANAGAPSDVHSAGWPVVVAWSEQRQVKRRRGSTKALSVSNELQKASCANIATCTVIAQT